MLTILLFPASAANTDDGPCDKGDLQWGLIFDYLPDVYILCEDLNGNLYERYVGTLPN